MKLLKKFETINLLSAQFLLLLHLHLSNNLNLIRHKTSMKGSMKSFYDEEKVKRAKDVKKLNDRVKSIRIPVLNSKPERKKVIQSKWKENNIKYE